MSLLQRVSFLPPSSADGQLEKVAIHDCLALLRNSHLFLL